MRKDLALVVLLGGCTVAGPHEHSASTPLPTGVVLLGSPRWKSEHAVTALAATPDGRLLATGDAAGAVRVLSATDGSVLHAFADHTRRVRALAFSPDGALLASVGEDRRAVLRKAGDGMKVGETRSAQAGFYAFAAAAFSPDGRTLAVGGVDEGLILIDASSGEERHRRSIGAWGVSSITWTPDGSRVVCGCGDSAVRLVDPISGSVARVLREPRTAWLPWFAYAAAPGPDGTIVAFRQDGIVDRWDASGAGGAIREEPGSHFASGAIAADGAVLIAARDGSLRRNDPGDGREVARFAVSPRALLAVACLGASGRVAAAGEEGAIRVLNVTTGALIAGPEGHLGPVYCIAATPDGRRVATGGRDGSLRLWDVATGREERLVANFAGPVYAVAFSRDGAELAAGGWDGSFLRIRTGDGAEIGRDQADGNPVIAIRARPVGGFEVDRGYPPALPGLDEAASWTEQDDASIVLARVASPDGRWEWRALFDGTAIGVPVAPGPVR